MKLKSTIHATSDAWLTEKRILRPTKSFLGGDQLVTRVDLDVKPKKKIKIKIKINKNINKFQKLFY